MPNVSNEVTSLRVNTATDRLRSAASTHLDAIRGGAALLVFLNHWRYLFFVDFDMVEQKSLLIRLFYLIAGMGQQAVIIFFVLSGFFISRSVFKSIEYNRWSWRWYAQQRLTRLYIVLLPALCLGVALDFVGIHYLGASSASIYGSSLEYRAMYPDAIHNRETLPIWLGNLFFLQAVRLPVLGSNSPLWSLSYEFWYYVTFPFLALVLVKPYSFSIKKIALSFASVLLLLFVGKEACLYFIIWLMGIIPGQLPPARLARIPKTALFFLLVVLFVSALIAAKLQIIRCRFAADCVVGLTFAALLYATIHYATLEPPPFYKNQTLFLSNISYTLYLTHVPALVLLNSWLIGFNVRWQPDLYHLCLGGGSIFIILAYVYAVWRLTEANTGSVRRWIDKRIPSRENSSTL